MPAVKIALFAHLSGGEVQMVEVAEDNGKADPRDWPSKQAWFRAPQDEWFTMVGDLHTAGYRTSWGAYISNLFGDGVDSRGHNYWFFQPEVLIAVLFVGDDAAWVAGAKARWEALAERDEDTQILRSRVAFDTALAKSTTRTKAMYDKHMEEYAEWSARAVYSLEELHEVSKMLYATEAGFDQQCFSKYMAMNKANEAAQGPLPASPPEWKATMFSKRSAWEAEMGELQDKISEFFEEVQTKRRRVEMEVRCAPK